MGTLSANRRWVRAARFILYGIAMLAALLGSAALFLPDLLDTPPVRAEIQRILSEAVRGEVAWEELQLRILPLPHGYLRKARLEIPQVASASAEEARVRLRFLPLFRGRAEITSVTVTKPVIRISITPVPAVERKTPERGPATDIFGHYRSVMGPVVDVVREFAPDTVVAIEEAELEVRVPGALPMQLSKLSLRANTGAKGMQIDATAASPYWSWLALSAHVEYADLSAKASLSGANIHPQAWLERYVGKAPVGVSMAQVRLSVEAGTDGRTSLECGFDARTDSVGITRAGERVNIPNVGVRVSAKAGAEEIIVGVNDIRLGSSRLGSGEFRFAPKDGTLSGHSDYDLDLAQGMDYTRRLLADEAGAALGWIQSIAGRAHGRVKLAFAPGAWSVGVDIAKADAELQIRDIPGPVRLAHGSVELDARAVNVSRVAVSMPAGDVQLSTLRHSLKDGATAGSATFDLDLDRSLELVRGVLPEANRDALSVIQSIAGRARGSAKLSVARGDWSVDVGITQADARVQVRDLPGPAGLAGGSARITPGSVRIERAILSLLDATATASATVGDFREGPSLRGSVADGAVGEKFLDWVWKVAEAPPRLMLKAPIRIDASKFAWGPKQALDVQAAARFDAGPDVAVDIGWTPGALEVRRAAIKDERSDAVVNARIAGPLLEGKFTGTLNSTSIASMLRSGAVRGASMNGDFSVALDRENPRHATADGSVKGEKLDLAWLIDRPVRIDRIDLAVRGETLQILDASVDWAGQRATMRGEVARTESGPVINAQIESPGLMIDALRKPAGAATDAKAAAKAVPAKQPTAANEEPSGIWPLPVSGRIDIRSEFVQSGRHKVAPVAATLVLEERRAHVDLKEAELCGISLPLVFEATPQGYSLSARITAQKQQLEQSARCLSGEGVLITGLFDMQADVSAQGRPAELLQNLKGTIRADSHDGRVMKFALLGNILSMRNVASLMRAGGPRLDQEGFPYRRLVLTGRLGEGRFIVDEGAFHSDALGLAANGWIALDKPESRLTVLVAPFSRLDELVRKFPVIGYVMGGVFTSVPLGVSGDIRDPLVVPLSPIAVTSEVLGIFERTLKLPAKLVTPEAQ